MMKKPFTFKIIICIMFGLAGGFFCLSAREDLKGYLYRKGKEARTKKRQKDFDKMMKLVNSQH